MSKGSRRGGGPSVSMMNQNHLSQGTLARPPQSPASLLVLKGSHASTDIGSSDIRVWSDLDRNRFDCVIFLQSGRESAEFIRKGVHTIVSLVPRIPLLGALLLNVVIILRFLGARFELTVFTPRTWLAAGTLRRLGVTRRMIMDVRSGPAHRWRFLKTLERAELKAALAFCRTDGLTFINERTKESVIPDSMKGIPVGMWGSGVDLDLFKPSEEKRRTLRRDLGLNDAKVVMYHGSITEDRGVIQLVRAVEMLQEREPNVRLILLGWGPDLARIRRKFVHLLDAGVLIVQRPVVYERVPDFLGTCDVGALPFPEDAKWNTQMPLKLLEYLAMGKLVVATELEAHQGFGSAVFLLPDNQPETLAGELQRIFRLSKAEREERLRDSRSFVERLSWRNQARALQDFIEEVMST